MPAIRRLLLAVCCMPVALVLAAPASAWTARPATYGIATQRDVAITMSDGTVLHADVLRPADAQTGAAAPGRFPVVLTQTPYNKVAPQLNFENDYLVQRGYVQVIVDVRGTGSSEGNWSSFGADEQHDGAELVRWARTQPFSDGRIALFGASYGAINQLFTAERQPKGLKAIFPIVPAADTYRDITGSGGQVNTSFIPSWLGLVTGLGLLPPTYAASDPVEAARVLVQHGANTLAFQGSTVVDATTGGDLAFDGPFYRLRSPIERIDRVKVPTFVVGGWFDLFQRGEPLIYQRLRANHVPTRLLMGPWTHLQGSSGAGLPAEGVPSLSELELRWFDHYVRGVADHELGHDVAPVTYYENGRGHWTTARDWYAPDVRFTALRLSGSASPGSPGELTGGPASGGPDQLVWNPATGVCSRSTVQWSAGLAGAGTPCETDDRTTDATGLSYRVDVKEPLRLLGPMTARLFVTGNGRDGQITARVEDVAPDGTATQISAGWQVLSLRRLDRRRSVFRDGLLVQPYHPFTPDSVEPVPAGQPIEVDVEIFPSGWEVAPGHALQLSLQTADEPHLTAPAPQAAASAGGTYQVLHDADHPSELILPVRR